MGEVDQLARTLRARRPEDRRWVAAKLKALGADAAKALSAMLNALNDSDGGGAALPRGDVPRVWADHSEGGIGSGRGVRRRRTAGPGRGRPRPQESRPVAAIALPALIEGLANPGVEIRRVKAAALAAIGPAVYEAVPAFVGWLTNPDVDVRWTACHALGAIGPKAARRPPHWRRRPTTNTRTCGR